MGVCWRCQTVLPGEALGRRDGCPGCGAEVRVCRNCRHYAPGLANDCREPQAERVVDKERANFCDHFQPGAAATAPAAPTEAARRAAEALFKRDS